MIESFLCNLIKCLSGSEENRLLPVTLEEALAYLPLRERMGKLGKATSAREPAVHSGVNTFIKKSTFFSFSLFKKAV